VSGTEKSSIEIRHWSEIISEQARQEFGNDQVIASGWSPSGIYHIGNFREAATCTGIQRQLAYDGAKTKFVMIVDDFDPLDKIPSVLKKYKKELKPYLGHPVCRVPDFTGDSETYAEHFAKGLIEAMELFEMNVEIVYASRLYKEGNYDDYLKLYYGHEEEVQNLLENISGNRLSTFVSVVCENCGSIGNTKVTKYDPETEEIHYECVDNNYRKGCGHKGKINLSSHEWKLKWRLDWPARQDFLNVTVEPAGKDHSVAGGSVDTSIAIHEKIFNRKPPIMVRYGFITLKGGKKLSGSAGTGDPAASAGKFMPPSSFLFMVFKNDLLTDIQFSPSSMDVPKTVDEYDVARKYLLGIEIPPQERAGKKLATSVKIAIPEDKRKTPPPRIKYMDLALVAQIYQRNEEQIFERLKERKVILPDDPLEMIQEIKDRLQHIYYWLDKYAPESAKFVIPDEIPSEALNKINKENLKLFIEMLKQAKEKKINDANKLGEFFKQTFENNNLSPKEVFPSFYYALLGKKGGPKASFLTLVLGYDYVINKLEMIYQKIS